MVSRDEKEGASWLSTGVTLWQLLMSIGGTIVFVMFTGGQLVTANEARITKIEVQQQHATSHMDRQEVAIDGLRASLGATQIAVGQINAKLDNIAAQLGAINSAIEATARKSQRTF